MEKYAGGSWKNLIFFPDNIEFCLKSRGKRSETEIVVPCCIDEFVQCDNIPKAFFNKLCCVINQIVSCNDAELGNLKEVSNGEAVKLENELNKAQGTEEAADGQQGMGKESDAGNSTCFTSSTIAIYFSAVFPVHKNIKHAARSLMKFKFCGFGC